MMGVNRALVYFARERVLAGMRNPQLARDVRKQAKRAIALLEQGLGRLEDRSELRSSG